MVRRHVVEGNFGIAVGRCVVSGVVTDQNEGSDITKPAVDLIGAEFEEGLTQRNVTSPVARGRETRQSTISFTYDAAASDLARRVFRLVRFA